MEEKGSSMTDGSEYAFNRQGLRPGAAASLGAVGRSNVGQCGSCFGITVTSLEPCGTWENGALK